MALDGFEKRLKAIRTDRGFTQKQLAQVLGITEQAISKWERGVSYPDISMLDGIATVLGCSLDFLLQVENGKKSLLSQDSIEYREEIKKALLPDILSLEFGSDLVPLFQEEMKNGFPRVRQLRIQLAEQWGMIVPLIRILDQSWLAPNSYQICVNGISVWSDRQIELNEDGMTKIFENLKEQILQHIELIFNNQMVALLVANLRERYPYVVESVIPDQISYSKLRQVILYLIRDQGYTVRPLILIIQKMEQYFDISEPSELAKVIAKELSKQFAHMHWEK